MAAKSSDVVEETGWENDLRTSIQKKYKHGKMAFVLHCSKLDAAWN